MVHNSIVNQQIVWFKKYSERNIIIPEVPQYFFTSSHCSEIFREIDDTAPLISEYYHDTSSSEDSFDDTDEEDDPIRYGIKYWLNVSDI